MVEIKKGADNKISLSSTIDMYRRLMKEGRIKKNSAGAQRLQQLESRLYAYRKWIKLPYAKRRHITSPV
jgi:hypothetical protein